MLGATRSDGGTNMMGIGSSADATRGGRVSRSRRAASACGIALVLTLVGCSQAGGDGAAATGAAQSAAPSSTGSPAQPEETTSASTETAPSTSELQVPAEIGRWALLEEVQDSGLGITYESPDDGSMIHVIEFGPESQWETASSYAVDEGRTESADGRLVCGLTVGSPTCLTVLAGAVYMISAMDPEVTAEDITSFATTLIAAND